MAGRVLAVAAVLSGVEGMVVAAGVALDVLRRHVVRPVAGAEGQVGEEGPADAGTEVVAHIGDGVVDEVGAVGVRIEFDVVGALASGPRTATTW